MSPTRSPLRRLADIISDAVDKIDGKFAEAGVPFPPLDEPFSPTNPGENLTLEPEVVQNAMLIVAATNQLASTVRLPGQSVFDLAIGFNVSSSLQGLLLGNVPEILREGGPKGVHAKDIAVKNGMDANKVSRLLRLLATHHVFREIEPDVWTNNRLSSFLDTRKPTQELFSHPENKHMGTSGFAALAEHCTSNGLTKGAASLGEVLTNPKTARSDDPTQCAWNYAFDIKSKSWFEWLQAPENKAIMSRFNIAMDGISKLDDGEAMLRGFPWESLPDSAKVVDVGGGIGSASLTVSKKFPKLRVVVQDRPAMQKQSEACWEDAVPGALKSGRFVFQGHDFFSPQPVKDADVFLLRMITHDYPTYLVIKILKHLRDVAIPGRTKLLIVDQVAPYAGAGAHNSKSIPGSATAAVPDPLLSNLGKANSMVYLLDIQMLTFHQGQERTLGEHIHATKESGWNITQLYTPSGSVLRHIVAEAV